MYIRTFIYLFLIWRFGLFAAQDEERKQKRLLLLHDERYESHKASETENDVMDFAYQVDEAILALRTNNEDFRLGPPLERNVLLLFSFLLFLFP